MFFMLPKQPFSPGHMKNTDVHLSRGRNRPLPIFSLELVQISADTPLQVLTYLSYVSSQNASTVFE